MLINKQVDRGIASRFRRGKDEVTLGLMNIAGGRQLWLMRTLPECMESYPKNIIRETSK